MENDFTNQAQQGSPNQTNGSLNQTQTTENPPKRPDNYMIWTVLSTILCCLPVGIVGIVYSNKVNTLYEDKKYKEAEKAAKTALYCAIGAAGGGVLFAIIYIIVVVIAACL